MNKALLQRAKQTAVEAAKAAGSIHRNMFGQDITIADKGDYGDLVTDADHASEKAILEMLTSRFPDHQIRSEETGWSGVQSDWLWLVDPLDGTNNFAIGMPVFAVSITLIYKKEPVLGVIYDSMLDNIYVAERGKGVSFNSRPLVCKAKQTPLAKLTIGWIQGHHVQKDKRASRLKQYLEANCKRVLPLWAPTLLWCALARGDLDAVVLYNSEGDDLYSGIVIAKEAGVAVMDYEGHPFEGMNSEPYIIACLPNAKETLLTLVKEGLKEKT